MTRTNPPRTARRAVLAVLAAVLVPAVAVPASAVPAQGAPAARAALAGTTVLTGTASASVPVRLARNATFRQPQADQSSDALQVTGPGRFVGLALVAEGDDPNRTVVVAARVQHSSGFALTSSGTSTKQPGTEPVWTIPKGDYRLYLLTDGKPVKVALKLGGLTGTKTLKPTHPAAHTVRQPENRLLSEGAASAGDDVATRGSALMYGWTYFQHTPVFFAEKSYCYYDGGPFRPGCTGADRSSTFDFVNANLEPTGLVGTAISLDNKPGGHGQGYSLVSAGLRDRIDFTASWLDLAAPTAAAPARPTAAAPARRPVPAPAAASTPRTVPLAEPARESLPATGTPTLALGLAPVLLLAAAAARRGSTRP